MARGMIAAGTKNTCVKDVAQHCGSADFESQGSASGLRQDRDRNRENTWPSITNHAMQEMKRGIEGADRIRFTDPRLCWSILMQPMQMEISRCHPV